MFGRRRRTDDRDQAGRRADGVTEVEETAVGEDDAAAGENLLEGPWDAAEPHPELPRVDLGCLLVPVLEGTDIQLVFAEQHGAWVTVRHQLSEMQLLAFAAPKRSAIWDEVRTEIATEIVGNGGHTKEREGRFGIELYAHVPAEPGKPASGVRAVKFVGVDGPRWFLRGLFAGAAADDPAAAAPLETVLSQVVVIRGDQPMAPRDPLELKLPAEAAAAIEEQARAQQAQQGQAAGDQAAGGQGQPEQGTSRFAAAPNPFQRGPEMTETR